MSKNELNPELIQLEICPNNNKNDEILESEGYNLAEHIIKEGFNHNMLQFIRYHIIDMEYNDQMLKIFYENPAHKSDTLLNNRIKQKYKLEKKGVNRQNLSMISEITKNPKNPIVNINTNMTNDMNKKENVKIFNINKDKSQLINMVNSNPESKVNTNNIDQEYFSINEIGVVIIGKELVNIPKEIFSAKNTLIYLNLSNNMFEYIPVDIILFNSLKILKLENNKIQTIPNEFLKINCLEILNLNNNCISYLPSYFSTYLKSLKELHLEYNNLKIFDTEITNLANLIYLNIAHNQIKCFPVSFKNMIKLDEICFEWFKYANAEYNLYSINQNNNIINNQNLKKIKQICNKLYKQNIQFINFKEFIQHIMAKPISLIKKGHESKTLLHYASINEDFSVMQELIRLYPDMLNVLDDTNHTPFSWSLVKGKDSSAKFLFLKGANPFIGGGNIGTPLHIAVERLNVFLVLNLIKLGENPNRVDMDGNTPLHIACLKMHENHLKASIIIKALLEAGAQPNVKNNDKWTPIHIASRKRDHLGVEWMIKFNAIIPKDSIEKTFRINKRGGQFKWTPVHIAAYTESPLLAQILGESSVDMFKKSALGYYPKKLVGSNGITMKIIEKYEKRWIRNFVLKLENFKDKVNHSEHKVNNEKIPQVFNLYSSMTKITYTPTEQSYVVGSSSKPSGILSPNYINITKKKPIYVESKSCREGYDIYPETDHDLSCFEIDQSIEYNPENLSENEESKVLNLDNKKKEEILERNVITRAIKNCILDCLDLENQNQSPLFETLHFNAEHYDTFLKDEFHSNYQNYKNDANNLKEKLIDHTIFSEKLKLFGMLKILHMHIMEYIYAHCNIQIDKIYYGLIYFNEDFALTQDGPISKNTLAYMNHYYELVPNTIMAAFLTIDPNKTENLVLKVNLLMLICDIYYFPGLKFLQDIIKDTNNNQAKIVKDEAHYAYNFLRSLILFHKARFADEINKKKRNNIKHKMKADLLRNQKKIFDSEKKAKIKF